MSKRIKAADLPEFDAAHYLDSETSIAAYLTDILEANDAALLAAALGDIARARGMTEIAKSAGITREALQSPAPGQRPTLRHREPRLRGARCASGSASGSSLPGCGWGLNCRVPHPSRLCLMRWVGIMRSRFLQHLA
jgi:probable addiction module antidote protein